MPGAHSVQIRERVVRAYEAGEGSYAALALRFSVGEASVKRWVWLHRESGAVQPRPKGGGTPSRIESAEVERFLTELGDPTAGELTAAFNRQRRGKQRVHVSSMKRALHRFGYVVKKSADDRWRVCVRRSGSGGAPT